jgi:hypothetical protein
MCAAGHGGDTWALAAGQHFFAEHELLLGHWYM